MKDYKEKVISLENKDYDGIGKRISTERSIRLLHGAIGLATESGELLDQLKKHVYYGKELDVTNLVEELGDLYWYLNLVIDEIGTTEDEVKRINFEKLSARYPDKFKNSDALVRDLDNERKILEGKE